MTNRTLKNATLTEISELANDLLILSYHEGLSISEAGAKVEADMDGTQPTDLIENAVALACSRNGKA